MQNSWAVGDEAQKTNKQSVLDRNAEIHSKGHIGLTLTHRTGQKCIQSSRFNQGYFLCYNWHSYHTAENDKWAGWLFI